MKNVVTLVLTTALLFVHKQKNWIALNEARAFTPLFFLTITVSVFHFLSLFLVSVLSMFFNVKKSGCK